MAGEAHGETRRRWGDLRLEAVPDDLGRPRYHVVDGAGGALGSFADAAAAAACFDAARALREEAAAPPVEDGGASLGPGAAPGAAARRLCEGPAGAGGADGTLGGAAARRAALRRDLRAALRALGVPDGVAPAAALCGRPRRVTEALLAALRAADAERAQEAGAGPVGLTPDELAARLGRPRGPVRALLYKLCGAGEVVALGRSRYGAAPAGGVPAGTPPAGTPLPRGRHPGV